MDVILIMYLLLQQATSLFDCLPSMAHFMAVLRSLRRRLIVWATYFWVCRHHSFGAISGCKLQRPMTNWQIDRFSLLNTRSVSLSTNLTLGNTVSVITKFTVVWSPVEISVIVCCSNQTWLGLLRLAVSSSPNDDDLPFGETKPVLRIEALLLDVAIPLDAFCRTAIGALLTPCDCFPTANLLDPDMVLLVRLILL